MVKVIMVIGNVVASLALAYIAYQSHNIAAGIGGVSAMSNAFYISIT